jgi:hypothetical protein
MVCKTLSKEAKKISKGSTKSRDYDADDDDVSTKSKSALYKLLHRESSASMLISCDETSAVQSWEMSADIIMEMDTQDFSNSGSDSLNLPSGTSTESVWEPSVDSIMMMSGQDATPNLTPTPSVHPDVEVESLLASQHIEEFDPIEHESSNSCNLPDEPDETTYLCVGYLHAQSWREGVYGIHVISKSQKGFGNLLGQLALCSCRIALCKSLEESMRLMKCMM